jgi:hypothetical protein
MKLRRLSLPRAGLNQLTKHERALLLLAGHIHNELNSLHKFFAWCVHKAPSSIENVVNSAQAQIYTRLLAGKLLEAWNALTVSYFGTKLSIDLGPALNPLAQNALKDLKAYFGKANAVYRIRNSVAFHYSADEFEKNWQEVADHPNFEIILGGTIGNNFYFASELVVNAAVLNHVGQPGQPTAEMYLNEIQSAAIQFTKFLEGAIVVLIEKVYRSHPKAEIVENISPQLSFEDIAIPYFYDHGISVEGVS